MGNSPSIHPDPPPRAVSPATPFVNAMRLNARQWLAVALLVGAVLWVTPWIWKHVERFETGPDYRIPYSLSKDYWLYERRLDQLPVTNPVVIGDSVIWGEYVRADGTLSHYLNEQSLAPGRFVNAGVNGLFPLALEGLIGQYGHPLQQRKVLLHCNVLWMTSPKTDLRTEKEERFNHADLVPQFRPRIPCYRADLNHRLAVVLQQHFGFLQWANHLQIAYFGQKSLFAWTLEEDGGSPPRLPNAYQNLLAQINLVIPPEPEVDPERGPASPRHKPWSTSGEGSTRFEWVPLNQSLQWAAFQRLVTQLKGRGNDVLVLLGPFNEHLLAQDNRPAFREMRTGIAEWLKSNQIPYVAPRTLPSGSYADASHPLTDGYKLLAQDLLQDPVFGEWAAAPKAAGGIQPGSAQP